MKHAKAFRKPTSPVPALEMGKFILIPG
jgi:hypothetical protein